MKYLKSRWARLAFCALLELGALSGAPIRPDQVEALLKEMNQTKAALVMQAEDPAEDPAEDEDDQPADLISVQSRSR